MKLEDIMLNDKPVAEGEMPRDHLCEVSNSNSQSFYLMSVKFQLCKMNKFYTSAI